MRAVCFLEGCIHREHRYHEGTLQPRRAKHSWTARAALCAAAVCTACRCRLERLAHSRLQVASSVLRRQRIATGRDDGQQAEAAAALAERLHMPAGLGQSATTSLQRAAVSRKVRVTQHARAVHHERAQSSRFKLGRRCASSAHLADAAVPALFQSLHLGRIQRSSDTIS